MWLDKCNLRPSFRGIAWYFRSIIETLLLKKLYCTLNSPDEYPKFCKSLTGSISIIGYDDVVNKFDTLPTSAPVDVVLFIFKLGLIPEFQFLSAS